MRKVIYGPPGTGKTRTLVETLAEYVHKCRSKEIEPIIRFMSFTKAPIEEAMRRIDLNLRPGSISTIHSYGFKAGNFTKEQVVGYEQLSAFFAKLGIQYESEEGTEVVGALYLNVLSYQINTDSSVHDAYYKCGAPGDYDEYQWFVKSYTEFKKSYGYVDFNDMLVAAVDVEAPKTHMLILDEAQDLTPLQWRVFDKLTAEAKHWIIAGDDDQAIFTHTGANPHGMVEFVERQEKFNDVTKVVLEKSWRLPRAIHVYADKVVKQISRRVDKQFTDNGLEGHIEFYRNGNVPFKKLAEHGPITVLAHDRFTLARVETDLLGVVPYDFPRSKFLNSRIGRLCELVGKFQCREIETLTAQQIQAIKSAAKPSFQEKMNNDKNPVGWALLLNEPPTNLLIIPPHLQSKYEMHKWGEPPKVKLRTIHQFKGLEDDTIVIYTDRSARAEEAHIGDPDSGHRVWYTGVTRARHRLVVVEGGGYPA